MSFLISFVRLFKDTVRARMRRTSRTCVLKMKKENQLLTSCGNNEFSSLCIKKKDRLQLVPI